MARGIVPGRRRREDSGTPGRHRNYMQWLRTRVHGNPGQAPRSCPAVAGESTRNPSQAPRLYSVVAGVYGAGAGIISDSPGRVPELHPVVAGESTRERRAGTAIISSRYKQKHTGIPSRRRDHTRLLPASARRNSGQAPGSYPDCDRKKQIGFAANSGSTRKSVQVPVSCPA